MTKSKRIIVMGAAGRDFHNFNVCFRDSSDYEVVAFTATQIPNIEGRRYPAELAGAQYPKGIPIYPEHQLEDLIHTHSIDTVVFSYSDINHMDVMHKASAVQAAGANFLLLGARQTMLRSIKPVVAICAVRTGCGKSQTTRKVVDILQNQGHRVVVIRHPMPYGDLIKQEVQRFETLSDIEKHNCTIEEREEYEPHIAKGTIVYAGVDYEKILSSAKREADVIVWDGGNNDTPFYVPDVHIVLFDPHRFGDERGYYPGETNLLMADIAIINKVNTAQPHEISMIKNTLKRYNPGAKVVLAESPVTIGERNSIKGKRVLIVEDGPTLTHGGMSYGAGKIAASQFGAESIVDPRPFAVGSIHDIYDKYDHLESVLPAMGYSEDQVRELEETLNAVQCDVVLSATPIDLAKIVKINKPIVRVRYRYEDCVYEDYQKYGYENRLTLEDLLEKYEVLRKRR